MVDLNWNKLNILLRPMQLAKEAEHILKGANHGSKGEIDLVRCKRKKHDSSDESYDDEHDSQIKKI